MMLSKTGLGPKVYSCSLQKYIYMIACLLLMILKKRISDRIDELHEHQYLHGDLNIPNVGYRFIDGEKNGNLFL